MKLVSLEGKWYFETPDITLYPFKNILQDTVNAGLEKRQYVVSDNDDPSDFTVMSMKGEGLEDHFSVMIIDLPEPETDPFVLIYKVSNEELAQKFRDFLSTFHPGSKTLYFKEEATRDDVVSLIKFFEA